MIARPKISRNERKPAERGAFEVGNFAPFSCPGHYDGVVGPETLALTFLFGGFVALPPPLQDMLVEWALELLPLPGVWLLAALRYVHRRAGQESEIPNFKASYLGRFPLVSADFWTSDHLSERSRSVDAFSGTRARGTLTLKRR